MIKRLLLFIGLIWITAACGGTTEPTAEPQPTDPAVVNEATEIQVAVASDDFAVGTPRIPFILFDGPNQVTDAQSVTVAAFDLTTETRVVGWAGTATNYSDYEVPYWVVYPQVTHSGNWGLLAEVKRADGSVVQVPFAVHINADSQSPAIGSQAPPSQNRTLATETDIAKLTSGSDPEPGLYQMTVADALDSGRPTVVILATPAFCQTQICAPIVKSVEAVYNQFSDQANFIHLEIYKDFQTLETADEVTEWALSSEPWTFVIDADGVIVARLGGPVSPRELIEVLAPLLS
jgi:hypothetical protein